jgi:rare lipoprotein A
MVAMNGPTPTADVGPAGFPGQVVDVTATGSGRLALPAVGPIAPERPAFDGPGEMRVALAALSYAGEGKESAASAFSTFDRLSADAVARSWKRMNESLVPSGEAYVAAASFTDAGQADRMARTLAAYGRPDIERTEIDGVMWYGVNLHGDGRSSVDDMLRAAWSHGAPEAIAVRD